MSAARRNALNHPWHRANRGTIAQREYFRKLDGRITAPKGISGPNGIVYMPHREDGDPRPLKF